MDFSNKWLGLMGGGGSASAFIGGSAYQLNMWRMSGGAVPMPVLITGKRLGLMAQLEAGHAICFISGVSDPQSFQKIESQGLDWSLNALADIDAFIKTAGEGASALSRIAAKKAGNWAADEASKKIIQGIMGDFSLSTSGPNFVLLPTPAAVGIGGGVFYEWQTMTKVGTDVAWRYIKPNWWVQNSGGKLKLFMSPIPEANGTSIGIQIRKKGIGPDDLIIFNTSRSGRVNGAYTNNLKTIRGTVYGGSLCSYGSKQPGLDLSALKPAGMTEIGIFSTSRTTEVEKNKQFKIGLSINKDAQSETNLYKWESKHYVQVSTGADGHFTGSRESSVVKS